MGEFLEKLLFPADLQQLLSSNAPLVPTCDATVARVHWEMVAQPDLRSRRRHGEANRSHVSRHPSWIHPPATDGLCPPPEPPPPPNRVLRVLIIGDPAADNPLPGAQEEAMLVLELFKKFAEQERGEESQWGDRCLDGAEPATRTRVMQELILKPFDVLHYAGHCMYDKQKPSASGWILPAASVSVPTS